MPRFGAWSPASFALSAGAQAAKPWARLPQDSTARLAPLAAPPHRCGRDSRGGPALRALAMRSVTSCDRASGGHRSASFPAVSGRPEDVDRRLRVAEHGADRHVLDWPGASAASSTVRFVLALDVQRYEAGAERCARQRQASAAARRRSAPRSAATGAWLCGSSSRRQVGRVGEERSGVAVLPMPRTATSSGQASAGQRLRWRGRRRPRRSSPPGRAATKRAAAAGPCSRSSRRPGGHWSAASSSARSARRPASPSPCPSRCRLGPTAPGRTAPASCRRRPR